MGTLILLGIRHTLHRDAAVVLTPPRETLVEIEQNDLTR